MPGNPPPFTDETDGLLLYLTQQRDGLAYAAYGLSEEQLRSTPTKSSLSVGGLLKHAAATEAQWADLIAGRPLAPGGYEAYADGFTVTDADTVDSLVTGLREVGAQTERDVRALDSLDVAVDLPQAPWFPSDPRGYTARWILLHVMEELARHAGHADIIREHIDGATMYALMAGAEGWPETDWLKPWRPPAAG